MVVTRVADRPIAFSGQTASYGNIYTYTERQMVAVDTRVITTPNPNPTDPKDTFYENLATGALPIDKISISTDTIRCAPTGTSTDPRQYINITS